MNGSRVTIARVDASNRDEAARIIAEYLAAIEDTMTQTEVEGEIRRHLGDARSALFLARVGGAAVGCIEVHPLDAAEIFEIKRLYVRAEARRLGIAARLMDAAEARARDLGARSVYLDTMPSMQAARALYESRGYRPIESYHENPRCHVCLGKDLQGVAP